MQYRFTFDHAVSDGQGGYGAVRVEAFPIDGEPEVYYIGRWFARDGVIVERFPCVESISGEALTYDGARRMVDYLSAGTTGQRVVWTGSIARLNVA